MHDFEDEAESLHPFPTASSGERREADLFLADLLGVPPPRRKVAIAPRVPSRQDESALRDARNRVRGGSGLGEALPTAVPAGTWRTVALPLSVTPAAHLQPGDVVVQRALGDARRARLRVLGDDIEAPDLYGPDGRVRPDVLVIRAETLAGLDAPATEDELPPGFLRWTPGRRAELFPMRPEKSLGGRAFMETIKGEPLPGSAARLKRDEAIAAELIAGNMPDELLTWVGVELSVTRNNQTIRGTVYVLPDYLCVGHGGDYIHVPLNPITAQQVADAFGAMLPTSRICHALYLKADSNHQLGAIVHDYYLPDAQRQKALKRWGQASTPAYTKHSEELQERMKARGIRLGELVAGHKKDVILCQRLHSLTNRMAFHGFYDEQGYPFEPCHETPDGRVNPNCAKDSPTVARPDHDRSFSDYAQGVRLVHPIMIYDGKPMPLAEVLVDSERSYLVSFEGPIKPPRIPGVPARPSNAAQAKSGQAESVGGGVAREDADAPAMEATDTSPVLTIDPAPGLGTAKTTAPIATVSPQRQVNELVDRELILFTQARAVAAWLERNPTATFDQLVADKALLAQLDCSKDKALLQKLRPFPKGELPERRGQLFTTNAVLDGLVKAPANAGALWPILDVLSYYGVARYVPDPANPFGTPSVAAIPAPGGTGLSRARFDTETAAVETFARKLKQEIAGGSLAHHLVEGESIPKEWSAAPSTALELARPVIALLRRVRDINPRWKVGTYGRHFWNDFSADIFLVTSKNAQGFYAQDAVREFFRALNAACEQDTAPGKFAWKGIYNDTEVALEMHKLYGTGRVLYGVDGHGPGPRMHIHLDLRPLTVPCDAKTGFWLEGPRLVLSPPPARTSVSAPSPTLPAPT